MVMELLGPSLEDLFNRCRRRFSLKTVLKIADQLLDRLDTLHERHLIHRDIKTNNFVIGLGSKANMIYCVDFGMSKRYRDPKTLQHTPFCDWKSLSGTPRYASINNHLGIRPTRRDDLEALAYILIYFLKGSLPWQGLKAKTEKEKYKLILKKKQETSIDALCHGCPAEFAEFVQYTRTLKFDEQPDIPRWRKIFRDLYIRANCDAIPKEWDWDVVEPERSPVSRSGGRPGAMDPPVARPINTMPPPPTTNTTVDRMTSRDNTRGPEPMSVGGGDLEEPYPVMDGPFVHPRAPAAAETDRYGVRPPQPPPNNSSAAMSPPNRFGFFPSNDRTRR
jgi:serine/threonine protein kinase